VSVLSLSRGATLEMVIAPTRELAEGCVHELQPDRELP
jgi:hypothetical protein